ncbi:MAG: cobalamin biosynthesis protein CobD [Deltaproteobacteria bacterium]|nr:cobalamin biosynthesis protein CobD [Deltaproteobacteria bacterium]
MILATSVALAAIILDTLIGDPVYRFHPVRLMGQFFHFLERVFFQNGNNAMAVRALGSLYLCICVLVPGALTVLLFWMLETVHPLLSAGFCVFVYYSLYAQKDLITHLKRVEDALSRHSLEAARSAVSQIVGRETASLDKAGIVRAAVESVAENYVDGFFSIAFGTLLLLAVSPFIQIPAVILVTVWAVFYRAVNTLDAMVGHLNSRYRHFGWASAKLDDALNFIPARLSVLPLSFGVLCHRGHLQKAYADFFQFRKCTASPNSGHPESFMAGALNICLGGPIRYSHGVVDKGWIGSGCETPDTVHVSKSIRIVGTAGKTVPAFLLLLLILLSFSAK